MKKKISFVELWLISKSNKLDNDEELSLLYSNIDLIDLSPEGMWSSALAIIAIKGVVDIIMGNIK